MAIVDRLRRSIERLPARLQEEVLDYADYLLAKSQREAGAKDDQNWSRFSLENAMRGIEAADETEYSETDIKDRFSS